MPELLLRLQRLQPCRFLVHVGIDETPDALVDHIHQIGDEAFLHPMAAGDGAERGGGVGQLADELRRRR